MYFLIYLADYRWKSLKYVHIHKAFIIDEMYANLYGFPFLLCEFIIICVAIIQVTNSTELLPKNEKEQNDDGNYNSSKSLCVCSVYGKKREKNLCVRLEIAVVPFQMQNERMAYRKKKKK